MSGNWGYNGRPVPGSRERIVEDRDPARVFDLAHVARVFDVPLAIISPPYPGDTILPARRPWWRRWFR